MKKVINFRISLKEDKERFWREMEVSSGYTLARLAYAILSTFEFQAYHLFMFSINGQTYEFLYDDFIDMDEENVIEPNLVKLEEIDLKVGDKFDFIYDFGSNWEFCIEVLSITDMEKGMTSLYPRVLNGKGQKIIEDIIPDQLIEIADLNEKNGFVDIIPILTGNNDEGYSEFENILPFYPPVNNNKLKREVSVFRKEYEELYAEEY